ncbi:MAG: helix-turn-helix domain-containing protein [Erysipelotrichales bacterium]|nr:helix-turn-helix domain-containing protein [Erysipelotrichales bacterium]
MENIRETIGENLAELRKQKGLTQYELAEKFNYSDKAISKWENGSTLPDIETLYQLCEFYDVTLDYLTHRENKKQFVKDTNKRLLKNRIAISCLLVSIAWMIATIVFVYTLMDNHLNALWVAFVWAIPVSCIILLWLNKIYFKNKSMFFYTSSILAWSILTAFFCQFLKFVPWPLFIVGIPMQVSLILWYCIDTAKKR